MATPERTEEGIPEPQEAIRRESLRQASVSDQPTTRDTLGFTPYVEAISRFLLNADTVPPVTMSIEGDWGSGKSSFMKQLKTKIDEEAVGSDKSRKRTAFTAWFNAWRHDKGEALWAAFALKFIDDLSLSMTLAERLVASGRLIKSRYEWSAAWWDIMRAVAHSIVWAFVALALLLLTLFGVGPLVEFLTKDDSAVTGFFLWVVFGLTGCITFVSAGRTAVKHATKIVGNPLRYDLKKHLKTLDYTEKVAFIEKFHRDFTKIVNAYSGNARVFVFVDDLDRCEIATAAELLQALNLMIGEDTPIVFILGIDRFKVAAGLAARSEKVLPYLQARSHNTNAGVSPMDALEYGLSFMDKFIQLPFKVPRPGKAELQTFLAALRGDEDNSMQRQRRASRERITDPLAQPTNSDRLGVSRQAGSELPLGSQQVPSRWRGFELRVARDSDTIQEIVQMVAPIFDYNPRRLKQFINVFRLKAYICFDTGLFNPLTSQASKPLSFEALGKFVALTLRWPLLIDDLERDPAILRDIARDKIAGRAGYWRDQRGFKELVYWDGASESVTEQIKSRYSLTDLDVTPLLRTSPKVQLTVPAQQAVQSAAKATDPIKPAAVFESGFRPIAGSTSPNGRYALAWAPSGADELRNLEQLEDGTYAIFDHDRVRNFLVELSSNRVLTATEGKHWGDRLKYNHWVCSARWSPNSEFVVEINDSKWATFSASAYRLVKGHVDGPANILELVEQHARRRVGDTAIRAHAERLAISLREVIVSNEGAIVLKVSGEVPKAGPGFDGTCEIILRSESDGRLSATISSFNIVELFAELAHDPRFDVSRANDV